ncbi:MAG: ribose 5-phosphate isomerase B [Gemmataceae bacterium]
MKIILGCDHRGFAAKQRLLKLLPTLGHTVTDAGTFTNETADYPDYAFVVAAAVGQGQQDRGILICGSGIGMCIAANKVKGVRAAPCHDAVTAEMSRRHNNANILCLSADLLGEEMIERIVKLWLETEFEGGRHARRVDKIMKYEATGK